MRISQIVLLSQPRRVAIISAWLAGWLAGWLTEGHWFCVRCRDLSRVFARRGEARSPDSAWRAAGDFSRAIRAQTRVSAAAQASSFIPSFASLGSATCFQFASGKECLFGTRLFSFPWQPLLVQTGSRAGQRDSHANGGAVRGLMTDIQPEWENLPTPFLPGRFKKQKKKKKEQKKRNN